MCSSQQDRLASASGKCGDARNALTTLLQPNWLAHLPAYFRRLGAVRMCQSRPRRCALPRGSTKARRRWWASRWSSGPGPAGQRLAGRCRPGICLPASCSAFRAAAFKLFWLRRRQRHTQTQLHGIELAHNAGLPVHAHLDCDVIAVRRCWRLLAAWAWELMPPRDVAIEWAAANVSVLRAARICVQHRCLGHGIDG